MSDDPFAEAQALIDQLVIKLKLRADTLNYDAFEMLNDVVLEASRDQKELLDGLALGAGVGTSGEKTSITKTGLKRVATGGASSAYGSTNPGRIDSGRMESEISGTIEIDGHDLVGKWGWADALQYFLDQDFGKGKIPAANSLVDSFDQATQTLAVRLEVLRDKTVSGK